LMTDLNLDTSAPFEQTVRDSLPVLIISKEAVYDKTSYDGKRVLTLVSCL